jgi:hypothetical protein
MVEQQPSKLMTRVRFPSPAPPFAAPQLRVAYAESHRSEGCPPKLWRRRAGEEFAAWLAYAWLDLTDQPIIVGMRTDPKPRYRVIVHPPDCAAMNADAYRPDVLDSVNPFEMQTRMTVIHTPQGVGADRQTLHRRGQVVECKPEFRRGSGIHLSGRSDGSCDNVVAFAMCRPAWRLSSANRSCDFANRSSQPRSASMSSRMRLAIASCWSSGRFATSATARSSNLFMVTVYRDRRQRKTLSRRLALAATRCVSERPTTRPER